MRAPRSGPSSALTLGEAIALGRQDLQERGRSPGTLRWFEGQARVVLRAWRPEMPFSLLTVEELQAFADARLAGKAFGALPEGAPALPQTVRHHLRFLGRLRRLAGVDAWPTRDGKRTVTLPDDVPHTPAAFAWEEALETIQRIRDSGHPEAGPHADLIEALLRTGVRRSEIARMVLGDIDTRRKQVRILGKRGLRHFPLSDRAAQVLRRAVAWLVARVAEPRRQGKRPRRRTNPDPASRAYEIVSYTVGYWQRRLKEPRLHPHAMRHTLGHRLAAQGESIATVARLLGHSPRSIKVTVHYYGISEKMLRDAVTQLP